MQLLVKEFIKSNANTAAVIEVFERRMPSGGTLHIEEIKTKLSFINER